MKLTKLILLTCIIMVSCAQKPQQVTQAEIVSVDTVEVKKVVSYYKASDWNLPKGSIVNFAPTNESVERAHADGEQIDIFIHIKQEDGSIIVKPIDYDAWLNLPQGAILN